MQILEGRGAKISYHDPHVPRFELDGKSYTSTESLLASVRKADLVVIVTDHSDFPYKDVVEAASVLLDTRNATKGITSPKILKI